MKQLCLFTISSIVFTATWSSSKAQTFTTEMDASNITLVTHQDLKVTYEKNSQGSRTEEKTKTLTVGDKAPDLKVTKWLKGTPQTLGKGNITVVEFWATWCGPCIKAMPHLTELAEKYKGKVNFVGVSVWESKPDDYTTIVPEFVKKNSKNMGYNVATDGPNNFMGENWVKAAKFEGIPASFLVDGEGKIAWLGHPRNGLDEAIDHLLKGKLDVNAVKAEVTKKQTEQEKAIEEAKKSQERYVAVIAPAWNQFQMGNYQKASDEADKALETDIEFADNILGLKAKAMAFGKLPELNNFLETFREKYANTPGRLGANDSFVRLLLLEVLDKDHELGSKVYKTCLKQAELILKVDKSPSSYEAYALALWRCGDKQKGLEAIKKAVEIANGIEGMPDFFKNRLIARLKEFEG